MHCPRCQHENRPQAKFCEECATPLAWTCTHCGTQLSATAKFCPECAHPVAAGTEARFASPETYTPKHLAEKILTSKSALEGERKQVTVLFADLKGSMELLADRDPEEARKLLDPVLELMMEAVHRYEGTVNQVIGDGIMALFGAPLALEDHAVRACYAALGMQEAVGGYAAELRRGQGLAVQIRVGLNSGEVVVRSIGSDLHMDYTALGQTTHLAARMEQLARPGTTLLTGDTLRLAEGYVEVKALGPVPVKGLAASVETYELLRAAPVRSRFQAAAARGLTRFVGRDAQMEALRHALEKARAGHGQVIAVVGEPGVGKSRLFWEFTQSHHTHGWLILESGPVSYGKATPYLPVIGLIKTYFQIEARDDPRKIREKVMGKLLTLDETLRPALSALLALLEVPVEDPQWEPLDPPQRRQRTLEAVKRLLLRESQVQPLCLVIEDLHWIDSETQALLDSLVEGLPTARLLLLLNYRPEYQHRWGSKTYYTQIGLDPLPPESAEELLQALLGTEAALDPLKRLLIERTEGNPFFLEESVRTLIETQALVGEGGTYRLVKGLPGIQVPATVEAVLAARVDRLPPEEKTLLQTAAVIGKDVPFPLLRSIAGLPEDALRRGLTQLQALEFLYEASLFPDFEYTFKHALTHEVAYRGLLQERKKTLHATAARALEGLYADRLEEVYDRLAYHYAKTDEADKAVEYLTRFAKKVARKSAHGEAVMALQEALAHVERLPAEGQDALQLDLVLRQVKSLNFLGRNQESLDLLLLQRARLERLRNPSQVAAYYFSLGVNYSLLGDQERAAQSLELALQEAKRGEDERTMGRAHALLTLESYWSGRPHEGIEHGRQAVALLERTQQHYWLALTYFYIATNYFLMGELQPALEATARAHSIGEAIDHPGVQSFATSTAGIFHALSGDSSAALDACRRGLELSPDPLSRALALGNLGYAYLEKGEADPAIPLLEQGARQMAQFRYQQNQGLFTTWLGEAYLLTGRIDAAWDLASQGLQLTRDAKYRHGIGMAHRTLGRIARANGSAPEAEIHLKAALETFASIQARLEAGRTHLDLAALAHAQGPPAPVTMHLTEAHRLFATLRLPNYLQRTEQLSREFGARLSEPPAP